MLFVSGAVNDSLASCIKDAFVGVTFISISYLSRMFFVSGAVDDNLAPCIEDALSIQAIS